MDKHALIQKLSVEEVIKALAPRPDPPEEGYPSGSSLKIASMTPGLFSAYNAYAPPNIWGSWVTVGQHIGSVTYTIEFEAVGDTLVLGQVRYWKGADAGTQVVESFFSGDSITTSNSVAIVEVRFKGVPLGSAVRVMVTP